MIHRARRAIGTVLAVAVVAGCAPPQSSDARDEVGDEPTPTAATACRKRPDPRPDVVDELQTEGVSLAGLPAVPLHDMLAWDAPAHDHPSWRLLLHSLEWTYPLIGAAADGDEAARDLLDQVFSSWLTANAVAAAAPVEEAWHDHTVALRTQVATCAAHTVDLASARTILRSGIDWLHQDDNYAGAWNHGVDQSLALLMAGCTSGDGEVIDLAVQRLDHHRTEAIDDDGVTNEQATGYQKFVHGQYELIVTTLEACRLDAERFRDARDALLPMIVHATRPNGSLAPIGDTRSTKSGLPPAAAGIGSSARDRVAIHDSGGYAFGRDGWGPTASWFSLRFGEGRIIHGHRDHASVLWDVHGTPVLTEAGFSGYRPGPWRDYERSHRAHNVVTVTDGGRFLWDHETSLVYDEQGEDHVSLTVTGRPYLRIAEHRRSVLISFAPQVIVVRDVVTADGDRATSQLWHLPPGWTTERATPRETESVGPDGLGLRVVQLRPGTDVAVIEGQEEPIQGFVANGSGPHTAAPVLSFTAVGNTLEYLTVLVPTGDALPELEVTRDGDVVEVGTPAGKLRVATHDGNLIVVD